MGIRARVRLVLGTIPRRALGLEPGDRRAVATRAAGRYSDIPRKLTGGNGPRSPIQHLGSWPRSTWWHSRSLWRASGDRSMEWWTTTTSRTSRTRSRSASRSEERRVGKECRDGGGRGEEREREEIRVRDNEI